jgi:hypothetical protein
MRSNTTFLRIVTKQIAKITGKEIDDLHRQSQESFKVAQSAAKSAVIFALDIGEKLSAVKQSLGRGEFPEWIAANVTTFKHPMAKKYIQIHTNRELILNSDAQSIREALAIIKKGAETDNALSKYREKPTRAPRIERPPYTPTPAEEIEITDLVNHGIMNRRTAIDLFRFRAHKRELAKQSAQLLLTSGDPKAVADQKKREQAKKRRERIAKAAEAAGKSVKVLRREIQDQKRKAAHKAETEYLKSITARKRK